jgi:predicted RNA binding protein YcfA (HicA-like mRNA interferase family)
MPKLPHLAGSDIRRALERSGFEKARQKGSPVMLRRGMLRRGAQGCVVPLHNEVRIGTLAGRLRPAEVTPEEFVKSLK